MSRSHQSATFDDAARAAAIESYDLGQFTSDTKLDDAIGFAAALCETPISLISVVEEQKQRFLARVGIELTETPRAHSFCAHAMRGDDIMVVPNATVDDRFYQNPLVTGEPHIRFYAGAPLRSEAGVPLGSLCVIDNEPRSELTDLQSKGLKLIATHVMTVLNDRRLAKEKEQLTQELSHRIKNIFSVIGGLIGLSAKTYPELKPLAADLRARVLALGRAHDFVRPHSGPSRPEEAQTSFWGMFTNLLSAYQSADSTRVRKFGSDLSIDDRSATPLALLFHELATNATKYGALSSEHGHVEISVVSTVGYVTISWVELGGPEIPLAPTKLGFGSTLVKLSVDKQLGGSFRHEWPHEGLRATIVIPEDALSRNGAKSAANS